MQSQGEITMVEKRVPKKVAGLETIMQQNSSKAHLFLTHSAMK